MAFGPAAMGYDRAITIFSPDGSLYQVDYAFEAVKKGWTAIGLKSKNGVVIASEKRRAQNLLDVDNIEKVFLIDDHVGCSFAGLASDGRVLIDYARNMALQHRLIYDEPISIDYLTKAVADVKQMYTQHGGVRPFGVALVIAGIDKSTAKLYMTEPSGQFMPYYAVAIGQGYYTATEFLEKNYKEDMSMDETILLALRALMSTLKPNERLTPSTVEIGYASTQTGVFLKMTNEEKSTYLQKL
ncbi:proteasome endopeptidase complex, archaeal, alpha subunit [Sulfolobus sp. A20]|uniref:archaeal proteasome endopeptidase complex subunit alpha n=1 Tax=Sulfolobaceae TaxID=118883 RepID=UPI000845BF68|nr:MULTISPECIES: archaeal proteasome endopeptidase complex subunit alpha [unclassified Sulfolobus]TRM74760.1 proteasome endopeptidase complex, archaeal, alpha subunit [Sulfolobus sp. A20-N-F8]TRM75787.1 proteasome endopeptidase complex, archaeal, alpha subunit [Sulfolobus sp. B5]TRM98678.1 proteasome endopeptidase complex, archaeal, alpha subunit [Sulfolobus sp. F1]TRN00103.1 proteasome endopeptidase complex, archaeal, alpha subunit [Sulfolobus sp. E1]AOL15760.1 proteasome endopeptidase comple